MLINLLIKLKYKKKEIQFLNIGILISILFSIKDKFVFLKSKIKNKYFDFWNVF